MVHQRITCDRCGETIVEDRTCLKATTGPLRHKPPTDLCHDCKLGFEAFLGQPPDPALSRPFPSIATKSRTPAGATN
jgi:hypothetical protein